jgi:ArsR family transcriptional regulator
LLASASKRVIAVDYSQKMLDAVAAKAHRSGLKNIDFRLGDIENLPIASEEVEIVFLSQVLHHAESPTRALKEAHRVLKPSGRVIVLDLRTHHEDWVRDKLKDIWLGFEEAELAQLLRSSHFEDVDAFAASREPHPPYFKTILATGAKPSRRSNVES